MKTFREKFADFLILSGISQIEAGEILGISQQAISLLINSSKAVRPSTRRKVFKSFPKFKEYLDGDYKGKLSYLEIVSIIESNQSEFCKIPQFMKMIDRIYNEHNSYIKLLNEVEQLRSKIRDNEM